jgi:hypothetical protein
VGRDGILAHGRGMRKRERERAAATGTPVRLDCLMASSSSSAVSARMLVAELGWLRVATELGPDTKARWSTATSGEGGADMGAKVGPTGLMGRCASGSWRRNTTMEGSMAGCAPIEACKEGE